MAVIKRRVQTGLTRNRPRRKAPQKVHRRRSRSPEENLPTSRMVQFAPGDQELGPCGTDRCIRSERSGCAVDQLGGGEHSTACERPAGRFFRERRGSDGRTICELKEGNNDLKVPGWCGPKLPSENHRFEFKLYALDDELNLGHKVTKEKVMEAIEGHVLGEAVMIAYV